GFNANWNTQTCIGIHEYENNGSVNLFPNPFSDQSTLVITDAAGFSKADLEIYDLLGQNVRSSGVEIRNVRIEIPIEGSGMSSGIYFYKVFGENSNGDRK